MKKIIFIFLALVVTLFINGCSNKEIKSDEPPKASLTNTYWKLTTLNDQAISFTKNTKREAHIVFADGKIKGHSGCNRMNGFYTLDAQNISLTKNRMMLTRMFCQPSIETKFTQALKDMHHYQIKGEKLELFNENNRIIARFVSVYFY